MGEEPRALSGSALPDNFLVIIRLRSHFTAACGGVDFHWFNTSPGRKDCPWIWSCADRRDARWRLSTSEPLLDLGDVAIVREGRLWPLSGATSSRIALDFGGDVAGLSVGCAVSIPKPFAIIERHIPDDLLGEGIGFPVRHLRVAFDHFSHGSPMPFMLATTFAPCVAVRPCRGSIGFEMRFWDRRNVSHSAMVGP